MGAVNGDRLYRALDKVGLHKDRLCEHLMERYRQSALARGYLGDSVVNSASDTVAMIVGFILARVLTVWASVGLVAAIELFLGFMIRDNFTLNVIQLIYPTEAISMWQSGN